MKIRMALSLGALAAALLLPTAAAARDKGFKVMTMRAPASDAPAARPHHAQRPASLAERVEGNGPEAAASALRIPERTALGAGTCTVTGTVLGYGGSPVANAWVQWAYHDASGYHRGTWAQTDASGHFGFSGVAVTNEGRLSAWSDNDDTMFRRDWLDFAPGANDYVLRPGALTVQATRSSDPDWNDWTTMDVKFYGAGTAFCEIAGASGPAYAMAPSTTYGIVNFWNNEAVEWQTSSPIPIVTGALSSGRVAVDEADAQQVFVGRPYWASGKPGATIGYDLTNWPAGYKATFAGYDENPDSDVSVQYSGEWTSTGSAGTVSLTVPKAATPGYGFDVHATRSDGLWSFTDMSIFDSYQVCTLKASKSSVRWGALITVSGVIPTQGHWGTEAGISKTVTLYAHEGSAAVPTKWDPKSQGWKKVYSIKADGYGRYKSKTFRPNRTLTLVVRYPGDDWYWDAYTSTQKIIVR
jgi:hypothetical protein